MARHAKTPARTSARSSPLVVALAELTRSLRRTRRWDPAQDCPPPRGIADGLHRLVRALAQALEADGIPTPHVSLLLFAAAGARAVASSATPRPDIRFEPTPPSAIGRLIRSRRPLNVRNPASDPIGCVLAAMGAPADGALWAVPLFEGGVLRGALILGYKPGAEPLPDETRAAVAATAELLGLAMAKPRRLPLRRVPSEPAKRAPSSPHAAIPGHSHEQFLEKIIETSVDAIVAADSTGRIVLFNEGAERISGYSAEEVIGRMNIRDLHAPNVAQEIMRRLRSPRFGGRGKLAGSVEAIRTREGREIPIHISATTIFEKGREIATVGVFTDLRDLLRLEKGSRESLEHYRNVVEQAHEGIGLVARGRLQFANQRLLEMLEIPARETGKKPLSKFLEPDVLKGLGLLARGRQEGQTEAEACLVGARGTKRIVQILAGGVSFRGAPARQIFVRDISARKELEKEYRVLVDTAARARQGIILVREQLTGPNAVVYANEEFCRFAGWPLEELRKIPLARLFSREGLETAREVYGKLLRGEEPTSPVRTTLRNREGVNVIVEASTARTTYGGKPAIIGYCRDVTGQAKLEEMIEFQSKSLIEKNRELEETIARLRSTQDKFIEQQKLAELGTFSAGIAHEIRNPLGLIRSYLHTLEEGETGAARQQARMAIERQVERTSEFIDKILTYARPSRPVRRRLDLNRTVSMAASFASEAQAPPPSVKIRRSFDPGLPNIFGDHTQIQELFINLITNAIQAVGGSGSVHLKTARADPGSVRVDVSDSGPGIPDEALPRIFLPFYTSGKGVRGTGMGLAIARRIVESHGGEIRVLENPEEGTTFRVHLPINAATPAMP